MSGRSRKPQKDGVTMVQQLRKSITTLVFFLFSGVALAQGTSAPLVLKPDAPDRYVVVSGDTLWGISERYTDSPWRWPELWNLNKEQIRNPHLIYPGYVILLDRMRGTLSIGGPSTRPPGLRPRGAGSPRALAPVKRCPRNRGGYLTSKGNPTTPPPATC